jgi:hypothetical protein
MAYQRRRKRSLQFEFLEKRETPSSITGEPFGIHPLALGQKTVPFYASGSAKLVGSPSSGANGSFTAAATGWASLLGPFTGLLIVTTNGDGGANIQVQLNFQHRSALQIHMMVLGNGSGGSPIDFQGTYDITGGSGAVARATGGGAVTGIVTPKTLSLTFNLQGSIWP